jgi:heme exporter protein A
MSNTVDDSNSARLEARDLHLWRGERHLLRGVSFKLERGELLQVVGPNGVGKTSLLRCVADLLPVESGEIEWQGASLRNDRDAYHQSLAYLAHVNALKADLTALENLKFAVGVRRQVAESSLQATLEQLQIAPCAHLPVRSLSAGQKRRVSIARILLTQARLWIREGGMILTAAHQLLLQGQSNVRTLELH